MRSWHGVNAAQDARRGRARADVRDRFPIRILRVLACEDRPGMGAGRVSGMVAVIECVPYTYISHKREWMLMRHVVWWARLVYEGVFLP